MNSRKLETFSKRTKQVLYLTTFLKLLSDPNRLRVIEFLGNEEKCVCEIVEALRLPQNLTSHHLGKLKELAIVKERKQGSFVYYQVDRKIMRDYFLRFNSLIKSV